MEKDRIRKMAYQGYWNQWKTGITKETLYSIIYIAACMFWFINGIPKSQMHGFYMIPIGLVLLIFLFYKMPFGNQMYLVPLSQEEKVFYLEVMLRMKVLVPSVLGILLVGVIYAITQSGVYALMLEVVFLPYFCWTTSILSNVAWKNQMTWQTPGSQKNSFTNMSEWRPFLQVILLIQAVVVFSVVAQKINEIEFILLLVFAFLINLPIGIYLRKRWPDIKKELTLYEHVMTEEK